MQWDILKEKEMQINIPAITTNRGVFVDQFGIEWDLNSHGFRTIEFGQVDFDSPIARLPEQAKTQAIEKLTHADVSEFHKEQFKNIIMFMEQGQSSDGQELVKTTQKTDRIRGEILSKHHPELAEAIGYEA